MTNQEILNYFGNKTVYKYSGTVSELQQLQETTNNSYNYIVVLETIYFVANDPVTDPEAQIVTGV